jgi:hypothetical protein
MLVKRWERGVLGGERAILWGSLAAPIFLQPKQFQSSSSVYSDNLSMQCAHCLSTSAQDINHILYNLDKFFIAYICTSFL